MKTAFILSILVSAFGLQPSAFPFEGCIQAVATQGGETKLFLYTVSTNTLRIERTETNWPHARNLVDRQTGALTLLFPHNRSFVRLKPAGEGGNLPRGFRRGLPSGVEQPSAFPPAGSAAAPLAIGPTNIPGMTAPPPLPQMPNLPAPPSGLPSGVGPPAPSSGAPSLPAMPLMPMMPMGVTEKAELKATGQKTNLLGYACEQFELNQRGETLEVWATGQLFPFQAYQQNQPHRFGPRLIEEQWPELLKARRLFPLRLTLRYESGPERYRFEVKSIQPEKITDPEGKLFQPPPDYQEIEPLPF